MKTIKLSYLLFSLAMITALVLAVLPASPAQALSASAAPQGASISAADNTSPALNAGVVVCKTRIVWREGHRLVVRVCHKVPR